MKKSKESEPTPLELATKVVMESGNSFHCKVATAFRDKEWDVTLSPYYVDDITNRTRELDLLCVRNVEFGVQRKRSIEIRLLVECKYIKNVVVFWFDRPDTTRVVQWIAANTGITGAGISEHHYLKEQRVAKLFASGGQRQDDQDPFYKAINQCLGGLAQHRPDAMERAYKDHYGRLPQVPYPVIVHSDDGTWFHETSVGAAVGPPRVLDRNFLLEVDYAHLVPGGKSAEEFVLIDIVGIARLNNFLHQIDLDIEAIKLHNSD